MTRAVAVGCLLLAGCASSSLTLLEDEGGGSGKVAVLESNGRPQDREIDAPNSRTALGRGQARSRALDPSKLSQRDRDTLANLPPPPRSFTLYFYEGATRLLPDSEPELQALFAEVREREGAEVQVTGYTDREGSDADNDALSEKRAREIRDALVARGDLPLDITSVVGRGERDPLVPTADGVANRQNRRVVVVVR